MDVWNYVFMYVCVSPVNLLACIFSGVLSLALKQHMSFRKSATEMNVSLIQASVKFRLSCTVRSFTMYDLPYLFKVANH